MKKRLLAAALALALALTFCVPTWAKELQPGEDVIYGQLSPAGQQTYDFLTTPENLAKVRSGEPITINYGGNYDPDTIASEIESCVKALYEAYGAIVENYPLFFWLAGSNISWSGYEIDGDRYVLPLTLTYQFRTPWASGARSVYDDEAAVREIASAVAEEACLQGGPWYQLLYVHDWLAERNVYNTAAAAAGAANSSDYLPWTPLSALTDESQPVCEGYAKAFCLICDYLGYPCMFVHGIGITADGAQDAHGWNLVQVNGKWYGVDVTFDDADGSHKYFMVGEETLIDDYYIFSDNHIPLGEVTDRVSFTYPAMAADALDPDFSWSPEWPGWQDPEDPDDPDEPPYDPGEPEYPTFADVDEFAYYAPAVQWAVQVGVTNGTGTDAAGNPLFSPEATVTRGQAVTFLWRAMGEPEPETQRNPFADVSGEDYYYEAVLWAVENGITNGTGHDTFSPADPVTRGQMLTFLWRTMGRPLETEDYEGKAWYADAELWAWEYGVTGDTAYSTAAECPRSDVVYYLFHAILFGAG